MSVSVDHSSAAGDAALTGKASSSLDRTTHFVFDAKVFSLERAYFSLARDTKEPVYHVHLGALNAALPLPTLRAEFNIDPDSSDGRLLDIIEKSLRYVREIRPNDSIPSELLDGTASWAVEDRHRVIAQQRLLLQVSSWLTGDEVVISDVAQLEQLADDPATKQRVQRAFDEIAERIGIGRERKKEVTEKIDDFARELAYIEALRERCTAAKHVAVWLARLSKVYSSDRTIAEEIVRILQLLRPPIADLEATLGLVDAQTAEILNILKKFDVQVNFVREIRDDLSFRLSAWDAIVERWSAHMQGQGLTRCVETEAVIKETYRFAAQNFLQGQSWRR